MKLSFRTLLVAGLLLAVAAGWMARAHWLRRTAFELSLQCYQLSQQAHWETLKSTADELIAIASDDSDGWYWKGEALRQLHQFDESIDCFEKVGLDDPRGLDAASVRMELIFHVRNDPLQAIALAGDLLARDPALAEPRRHLIYFFAMTGQRVQLREQVREAIDHNCDLPLHYVYLMTSEDLSFRDAAELTAVWSRQNAESVLLKHASLAQSARLLRGRYLTDPNETTRTAYAAVLDELRLAVQAHSADTLLLEVLCLDAVDRDDVAAVEHYLSQAPSVANDDAEFQFYRGWYAARRDAPADAERSLREAIRLYPLSVRARNELAAVLRLAERPVEAAAMQRLAAEGAQIIGEIRRLDHAGSVTQELLLQISEFASHCEDFAVSQGIYRRLKPRATP